MEKPEKLGFDQACKRFRSRSVPYTRKSTSINLEALIDLISKEFRLINIKGIAEEQLDADMLFFEYGIMDHKTNGMQFSVSLKRQVMLENLSDGGTYGFTAYFDSEIVNLKNYFVEWCEEKDDTGEWLQKIKSSEGYKKVKRLSPVKVEIEVEKS